MKKYEAKYTTQSVEDMDSVFRYIAEESQAPLTAKRYMEGIKKEADIIFSVEGNIAYIHHIVPQKMIIFPIVVK